MLNASVDNDEFLAVLGTRTPTLFLSNRKRSMVLNIAILGKRIPQFQAPHWPWGITSSGLPVETAGSRHGSSLS